MRDGVHNLVLAMGAPPGPGVNPYVQLIPIALVFAIFYFIILLPTKRRQKKLQEFLDALKVGDRVVTSGGIYGLGHEGGRQDRPAADCRQGPDRAVQERDRGLSGAGTAGRQPTNAMSNLRWKLITILIVFVVFFGVGVYPILASRYNLPAPQWLRDRQLKLGLDLKGGVHLVLRVQTDDALAGDDRAGQRAAAGGVEAARACRRRSRFRMSRTFRVDGVPAAQDQAFRQAAEQEAVNFERSTGTNGSYTFRMRPNIAQTLREEAVVQARQTIERRVNELGVTEPSIAQQGERSDSRPAAGRDRRRPRERDHRLAGHARAEARRAGAGGEPGRSSPHAPGASCRPIWKC